MLSPSNNIKNSCVTHPEATGFGTLYKEDIWHIKRFTRYCHWRRKLSCRNMSKNGKLHFTFDFFFFDFYNRLSYLHCKSVVRTRLLESPVCKGVIETYTNSGKRSTVRRDPQTKKPIRNGRVRVIDTRERRRHMQLCGTTRRRTRHIGPCTSALVKPHTWTRVVLPLNGLGRLRYD